jgi:pyrroloquinoline quinone biosynthesis protein B
MSEKPTPSGGGSSVGTGVTTVLLRVLGSAAGGGSPQWNCGCPVCAAVRSGASPPRSQSSVAVSADNKQWFVINASPDVRSQIEAFPGLHPHDDRSTPLEAVLLTDGELDHTLGLLLLREASAVRLYATPAVHKTLCDGSGVLRTLERYCPVEWRAVVPGADFALADGLSCRAFDVPSTKRARFGAGVEHGRVVGYRLTDERSGGTLVYLPGVQSLTPAQGGASVETLRAEIEGCDCLLIDGTCWRDDELVRLGLAGKTSREMGHLPIDGPDGSLAQLRSLGVGRTIFVHMNNTNPILLEDAPERRIVEDSGMEVAMDGLEVEV